MQEQNSPTASMGEYHMTKKNRRVVRDQVANTGLLAQYGIVVSMSGNGDCYDNALMESFFGTLKSECVDRQSFQGRAQARQALFEYLEAFYNRQRLHSSLGYVSPVTYEQQVK